MGMPAGPFIFDHTADFKITVIWSFFKDFLFDVECDFGILVDLIQGNESQDVLGGDHFLLQFPIVFPPQGQNNSQI